MWKFHRMCSNFCVTSSRRILILAEPVLESGQVYFTIRKFQEYASWKQQKKPCVHQSRLHLVAIYLKILEVINLKMTNNKQTNKKTQTGRQVQLDHRILMFKSTLLKK